MSTATTGATKKIAIISDDKTRKDLIEWSYSNRSILCQHEIIAATDTAEILEGTLNKKLEPVELVPGSFYRQVAAMIREHQLDLIVLLTDTGATSIINTGVQQLHELAIQHGVAVVSGRATAELVMPSLKIHEKSPSAYANVLNMIRQNVIMMGGFRRRRDWAV
jgi:methylglyoxal synthase